MSVHPNSLANLQPPWTSENRPNPTRRSAGATVKEWVNHLAQQDISNDELRKINREDRNPARRIAAARLMRAAEHTDLADFEKVLEGAKSLDELRADGIDTSAVKKCKRKKRSTTKEGGEVVEEVEYEIEMHDRSLQEAKAVLDYTDGTPTASATLEVKVIDDPRQAAESLKRLMGLIAKERTDGSTNP